MTVKTESGLLTCLGLFYLRIEPSILKLRIAIYSKIALNVATKLDKIKLLR